MYILFKRFFSYSAFQNIPCFVLDYSVNFVFQHIPYTPYFRIFRVFHHFVPSFRQSANMVTRSWQETIKGTERASPIYTLFHIPLCPRPVEEAKNECYKRRIYKQFAQVSGLCGPQFLSYLPKRFTHLCRALYRDAILVYRVGEPIWPLEINKNIRGSLFL